MLVIGGRDGRDGNLWDRFHVAFDYYLEGFDRTDDRIIGLEMFRDFLENAPQPIPMDVLSDLACLFAGEDCYKSEYSRVCYLIKRQLARQSPRP